MVKDADKPKGRMTAYACFVQTCREEHKKLHPGKPVVFAEFSRKCAEKWRELKEGEKKRFDDMAAKDKKRWEGEMKHYVPPEGAAAKGKRKMKKAKDPNAPKRSMSGFFFFSGEHRAAIKAENPGFGVGDIAKRLGVLWGGVSAQNKTKYEEMAKKDRARYEREMAAYKAGNAPSPKKKQKVVAKPVKAAVAKVEESEEEDEEDEEEEEEEEDDDEEEEEDDE